MHQPGKVIKSRSHELISTRNVTRQEPKEYTTKFGQNSSLNYLQISNNSKYENNQVQKDKLPYKIPEDTDTPKTIPSLIRKSQKLQSSLS